MENNRTFEITDLAGENLENIRWHGYMKVYAIVSTTGGDGVKTEVDYDRETNPKWDTPINFTLHDPSIHNNSLDLNIQFFCDRTFKSDKYIAGFSIPVKLLFDEISGNVKSSPAVRYPVVNSAGQEQGFVKFSYKFGELPKPTSQQQPSTSSAEPKPISQLPPQQRPPSQSPQQPSSQQPQPSQRPKRQPQSPKQQHPQLQLPSQSPQPPSSQQPRPPQRPKRQPQSPEQPPPQEQRPSSQSAQQPRPRPQQPQPQQQGPPPQTTPSSVQQQLRPQQPRTPPRPQQQQYPQQSRPPPPPQQQQPYPQLARPQPQPPRQRPYPQQARPQPPRPRPPAQSTQNAAAFRAQFVATGQVQLPLSENSPNPHENPPEPALDNHIDQLNISVEAQYGIDPDHDNNIPGDNQFEYPENEAYGQVSAPEYEHNENNHEEGYGKYEEGYGYDVVDYGDGEEVIEEGYQDDGVNNGEVYGGGEENYDDEECYGDEGNEEDCCGEEEEEEEEEVYEDDEG
ncbi:early nodule-specific protein 2-like [Actinidia eriantha]|uniref:early nodule-specific protein 2-like n=1 Tax=Actinidia eriantha TaxID=165200 RepID=UPI00258475F4|nr:early nodule-specific protein 2-like [Actinidia eriantha]